MKLLLFDFFILLSDWCDAYVSILKWVVGCQLPVKVKVDGMVGYEFSLVSEQLVHEIVSGIQDADDRVTDLPILVIICSNLTVLKYRDGVFEVHNTETVFQRSGCQCKINCKEIQFFGILLFPDNVIHNQSKILNTYIGHLGEILLTEFIAE